MIKNIQGILDTFWYFFHNLVYNFGSKITKIQLHDWIWLKFRTKIQTNISYYFSWETDVLKTQFSWHYPSKRGKEHGLYVELPFRVKFHRNVYKWISKRPYREVETCLCRIISLSELLGCNVFNASFGVFCNPYVTWPSEHSKPKHWPSNIYLEASCSKQPCLRIITHPYLKSEWFWKCVIQLSQV